MSGSMRYAKGTLLVLRWLILALIFGLAAGDSYENIQLQVRYTFPSIKTKRL